MENKMAVESVATIREIFSEAAAAHQRYAEHGTETVAAAADAICRALLSGHKVLSFGNGGSASDAEHLAAELVGRFEGERRSFAGIALTADSSVVTAIGNDYGFDRVFARQVEGLGVAGDVAFGISTSGRSPNVESALAVAKARGLVTIAMTGRDGGRMGADADIHLNVPETATPRIQEVHRTIMHAMCSAIEARMKTE
jgi:phosphoheptose isomerase